MLSNLDSHFIFITQLDVNGIADSRKTVRCKPDIYDRSDYLYDFPCITHMIAPFVYTALEPPTISVISCVIAACLALL